MHAHHIDSILDDHRLRKTPTRVDLLRILAEADQALSSQDIETRIPDADRITLYRTIKTFEEKGIIHQAIDGTLKPKYAMCSSGCTEDHHNDSHAHFHCESCGMTRCVDEVRISTATLPPDLQVSETSIVLKGRCSDCST